MRTIDDSRIRKYCVLVLLVYLALVLCSCEKKETVETVQVYYPDKEEENSLKDIFEYNFSSTWTDMQDEIFSKVESYDVMHMSLTKEYWEMFNVAQTGFGERGDVWVNLQENGYIANRTLDMLYGFYETDFPNIENSSDWRIWTAPNGSKRIIRGIDKKKRTIFLVWQEDDGKSFLLADELKVEEYDIQCVWSGDSEKVFIRIMPNNLFPEKNIVRWDIDVSGGEKFRQLENKMIFKELNFGDIWRVERSGEEFVSRCVYKGKEEDTLKSSMIASYDGELLLTYMGDSYEAVMKEQSIKSRHTATYIEEQEDGTWASYDILHFNSKVDYTSIVFDGGNLVVTNTDGEMIYWNPKTAEQVFSENVIVGGYDTCTNIPDEGLIFVGTATEIDRYIYDVDSDKWQKSTLYKSPQGSSILSIQYDGEAEKLLLLYLIDDSVRNSQRFEVVCLQLMQD